MSLSVFLFGIVGYIMRKVNMNTAAVVLAHLSPWERGCAGASSGGDISVLSTTHLPSAHCTKPAVHPHAYRFTRQ